MILEQVAILGLPSIEELKGMSKQITDTKIELIHRLDSIQRTAMAKVLPQQYL